MTSMSDTFRRQESLSMACLLFLLLAVSPVAVCRRSGSSDSVAAECVEALRHIHRLRKPVIRFLAARVTIDICPGGRMGTAENWLQLTVNN